MELEFRPATPADADHVVPLMHGSSRDMIDVVFGVPGRDVEDFLRRDFLRGSGLFGWRHQRVVVADSAGTPQNGDGGRIVASVTCYPGRSWRSLSLQSSRTAMAHFRLRELAGVGRRSAAMGKLFIPPEPTGFFIANACVAEEMRNGGVGTRLFRHLLQHAADGGFTAAELDVSEGNKGARALYERLGFEVIECREDRSGLGFEAFLRMRAATAARAQS